jgi:hypothetical protein
MTMTKVSVPKMTMTLKKTPMTERKRKISLQMGDSGRSNHRAITRSLPSTGTGERIDIEYAESVSDLEERILMHDDLNIPSDDDEDEEVMDDEDDDESTLASDGHG